MIRVSRELSIICILLAAFAAGSMAADLGTAFTYQGDLTLNGNAVEGPTDFQFSLWDAASAGNQIGNTQAVNNLAIADGLLAVVLNANNEFGDDAFTGDERWLEIVVEGNTLSPRQELTAAPYAQSLRPGAIVAGTGDVLTVNASSGSNTAALTGSSTSGGANSVGVLGEHSGQFGRGVYGHATHPSGSTAGVRGVVESTSSNATGMFGLIMSSSGQGAGVKGQNNGTTGYGVWGQGGNGAYGVLGQTNGSNRAGVWAYNSGSGTGLRAESGGNLIEGWDLSPVNLRFSVDNSGNVKADGTYTSPAADFAEMLPAEGNDLEPGDVLAIGKDGQLQRSTGAYDRTVAGVYSTKPAFMGGVHDDTDMSGKVPLAVVGIVPVKVSAENGPIEPGDMLAASDIPGHAMRAVDAPNGTIIGKALSGLESGTGTIHMLVILQ